MGPETARVAAIEQALADYKVDRPFEVRVDEADEYHDRFVLPDGGPVWALGAGTAGVGKRHSAMVEIKDRSVVEVMRRNFERVWDEARVLNPEPEPRAEVTAKKLPEEADPTANGLGDEELEEAEGS
jgi:hypothetical protein